MGYKLILYIIFAFVLSFANDANAQRILMGKDFAKKEVREAVRRKYNSKTAGRNKLIIDKATAISVAEIYLFKTYGKAQILKERPYEVYLIDGYWWLRGTLPKGWDGGGFEIILSAADGRVICLTHYK